MSEFVSRDMFEERSDKFMEFFKNDKESLRALTAIANQHEKAIERLLTLEESNVKSIAKSQELTAELAVMVRETSTIGKDNAGRLENHATRIKEIEDKPKKRMEAIVMDVLKFIAVAVIGIVAGYFLHG